MEDVRAYLSHRCICRHGNQLVEACIIFISQRKFDQYRFVKLTETASVQLVNIGQKTLRYVLKHLELLIWLCHLQLLDKLLILYLDTLFFIHKMFGPFRVEGRDVLIGLHEGFRRKSSHLNYGG